jgi:hypothetical protein
MRPFFLSIFFFFLTNTIFSQIPKNESKFKINPWDNVNGFRIAPSYLKNFEFEASYIVSSYPEKDPGFGGFFLLVQNIGAGLEYLQVGNQSALGAKLSYELNYSIFSAQIGSDIIVSNQDVQYRILPRVGLSVFGIITAYYGWNYNLKKDSNLLPAKHLITLQINVLDY